MKKTIHLHKKYSIQNKLPDKTGHFGDFGGRFVPETLIFALDELTSEYAQAKQDKKFTRDLNYYLTEYAGRPTPLYEAKNLSRYLGIKKVLNKNRSGK